MADLSVKNIASLRFDKILASLVVLFFSIYFFNLAGEKFFFYKTGLGIDGTHYGNMLRGLPESLYNNTVMPYWYQKFFPVIIARMLIEVSGLPIDNPLIVKAFMLIDMICLTASVIIYLSICKLESFSRNKTILGFVLIFISFAFLKYAPYEPLLTDRVAFLEAMLLLYCYIKKYWVGGLAIAFIGLFTFPLVIWLSASLLFMVRGNIGGAREYSNRLAPALFVALVPVGITVWNYFFSYEDFNFYRHHDQATFSWGSPASVLLLVLSLSVLLFVLTYTYKIILSGIALKQLGRAVYWNRVLAFGTLYVVFRAIMFFYADNTRDPRTAIDFIEDISHQALVYPGGYFVSHFMFFGSVVVLFGLLFKRFLQNNQAGLTMLIMVNAFFLISTESREFIYLLPFVAYIVIKNINESFASDRVMLLLILGLNLVVSLFWFKVNTPEIYDAVGSRLTFPKQRFYMLLGPWRNLHMYMVYAASTVISSSIIILYIKNKQSSGLTLTQEQ